MANRYTCGSHAINPHLHGRDDTDLDLCDVCYWRKRALGIVRELIEVAQTSTLPDGDAINVSTGLWLDDLISKFTYEP